MMEILSSSSGAQNMEAASECAEEHLFFNADSLVLYENLDSNWIEHPEGEEFMLVNAEQGARIPVFDHARMSEALSEATSESDGAYELPFDAVTLVDEQEVIESDNGGRMGVGPFRLHVPAVAWGT